MKHDTTNKTPTTDQANQATTDISTSPGTAARRPVSRRAFLGHAGAATAVALASGVIDAIPGVRGTTATVEAAEIGPVTATQRRDQAFNIRYDAALYQKNQPLPAHPTNGDEERYANQIGSYSKVLPHNNLGEVDIAAYNALLHALSTGKHADFEAIPLGGSVKLANPQAAYTFSLEGPDSHHLGMIAAPAFSSAETASEMAEVYWHALTRDVPFSLYSTHPLTTQAAADLSRFSDFRGPKQAGSVTPATLFRGNTPGDLEGPYISQFLWKHIPYGSTSGMPYGPFVMQQYRTTLPEDDHMAAYADWLWVQRGFAPIEKSTYDSVPRYIRNGRDLGEYVHADFTYQAFLNANLILMGFGKGALDPANPYRSSATQGGFVTFGPAFILDLVARVAHESLKATWYQKWLVHRRLRPEAYGGRVHNHITRAATYPISLELLNSQAVAQVFSKMGTYLLPMAYPEGSPTHPAYPAGHAVIAGACVTVLKAFYNESFIIPEPVVSNADGLTLLAYSGLPLTVGGELNKLASNIAIGRDIAGVHWRSDGIEGLKLGEAVAIGIMHDLKRTYTEPFNGFSLTKFDGTTITI